MDTFWALIYTAAVVLFLQYLYRYLRKPFTYWKERNVPSVPAVPIIGSLYENLTKEPNKVLQQRYKKYGRVYGIYESSKPAIVVGDPDLLKDIMVKDFSAFPNRRDFASGQPLLESMVSVMRGEEWKRVRTIVTPAFSSGKIKRMTSLMQEASITTSKNFEKFCDRGEPVDCKRLFGAFTMDVIAQAAFGFKLDSHNDPDNEFIRHAKIAFQKGISLQAIFFFIMPKLAKLLGIGLFAEGPMNYFKDVTLRVVKERRETGKRKNDFLQLMMDAADEAHASGVLMEETIDDESEKAIKDLGHDAENKGMFQMTKKYKGLSHLEMVAQCVIFFLAGYDTTSSALSFASYLLALNPDCQERLIKEIDETLKKNQNKLTYEAVQSMGYLDKVIWETLRILPPAIFVERTATEDYVLGSTGIKVPKGMVVTIPIYAIHHDPEYYEDPEKFDPDRFEPEQKNRRNPYTFLPFGAGPRNCVGMRFALIEIKFCLVILLTKFRLKRCPETMVPLEFFNSSQGLLQSKSIFLRIERRTDSVCVIE